MNNSIKMLSPFVLYCQKVIPLAFDESMSYYECLCALYSYLKETVVPAINNNAEALEELQKALADLKTYVDDYFENLDVQEEINNKLDEMAESGELADIIAQYLEVASVLGFDTVADMVAGDNLVNGSIVKTLGKDSYNDGFGRYYKIRTLLNSDVVDGVNIIALDVSPTLIAELIPESYLEKEIPAKVHFIPLGNNAGESSVIEIKDNNILIDLGIDTSFSTLVNYLINNGLTTFKYLLISHWDIDHSNSYENFVSLLTNNSFDFSDCTFVLPPVIDWTQTTGLSGQEQRCNQFTNYLVANGYTVKYPTEQEVIEVNKDTYMKFFNCDPDFIAEYYTYNTDDAGQTITDTAYNNFSVVTQITCCDKNILFTGDIYFQAEDNIAGELDYVDLIKIPHHGLNRRANALMLDLIAGKKGVITSTAQGSIAPLRPYYQTLLESCGELYATMSSGLIIADVNSIGVRIKSPNGSVLPKTDIVITENSDLNNYILQGVYICNYDEALNTLSNLPSGYSNQFKLRVEQITSAIMYQYLYTMNSVPIIWIRKTNNSGATWSSWTQLETHMINYLNANPTANTNITGTSFQKIPLSLQANSNYGSDLTVSGGSVVIGSNISAVKVSANVTFINMQAGDRLMVGIYKNNNVFIRSDIQSVGIYESHHTGDVIIPVTAGDTINLYVRNITGARGTVDATGYNSIVTVESIRD